MGRFGQVSHSLRYYWDYEIVANYQAEADEKPEWTAKIWEVEMKLSHNSTEFVEFDYTRNYTVATNSYIAGGGDDYDVFKAVPDDRRRDTSKNGGRKCGKVSAKRATSVLPLSATALHTS